MKKSPKIKMLVHLCKNFNVFFKLSIILFTFIVFFSSKSFSQRMLLNTSFELPAIAGNYANIDEASVPGWKTTDALNKIEIWKSGFSGVPSQNGIQFIELNANSAGILSQSICVLAGETITWSCWHRARVGTDVMEVLIDGVVQKTCSATTSAWVFNTGTWTNTGMSKIITFAFKAVSAGSGDVTVGNFLDNIEIVGIKSTVSFSNTSASSLEQLPTKKPLLLINGIINNPTSVTIGITGGTASLGVDYNLTSTVVNIPAGVYDGTNTTAITIPLTILDDAIAENTENISLTISSTSGDILISNSGCDISTVNTEYIIYDDDCAKPNLGADKFYCEGEVINQTLVGPTGNSYYEWSTGAITPDITVNSPGKYILKTGKYSSNLIVNGDFELGNIGFTTGYTYTPNTFPAGGGLYDVVKNGALNISWAEQFNDHTSGTGNYMFIDGNNVVGVKVWQQSITVTPNTDYVFSAWVRNISPAGNIAPILNFDIGGTNIGGLLTVPQDPDPKARQWNQIYATWNSGSNTNITISIEDNVANAAYNDFALDDIYFSPVTCSYTDTIEISQSLNPVLTKPIDQVLCNNDNSNKVTFSTVATGTVTYAWTNSQTSIGLAANGTTDNIAAFKATNTTSSPVVATISVTPSANGCPGIPQTFTYTINPTPVLTQPTDTVICNSASVLANTFKSTVTGTTYAWTNDNTTIGLGASGNGTIASFTATNTGSIQTVANISVKPTASTCDGVAKSFKISVNPTPILTQPTDTLVCNNASVLAKTFKSTVLGTTYAWANDNTKIGLGASGKGTITSFTATNSGSTQTVANVTVKPTASTCDGVAKSFKISVNPTPILTQPTDTVICNSASVLAKSFNLTVTGTTYAWTNDNTTIGLGASGNGTIAGFTATNTGSSQTVANITVKPIASTCEGVAKTFKIVVNPTPILTQPTDTLVCNASTIVAKTFKSNVTGTAFDWSNDNTSIGLGASGNGTIPSFTANNSGNTQAVATISVKPIASTCEGVAKTFKIAVNPTPVLTQPTDTVVCSGALVLEKKFVSSVESTIFAWANNNPSIGLGGFGVGNVASFTAINSTNKPILATIVLRPTAANCHGDVKSYKVTVNPKPVITTLTENFQICNGATSSVISFSSSITDTITTYSWTNDNINTGLSLANGIGNVPSFIATNTGNSQLVSKITVTPTAYGACAGIPKTFSRIVNPTPIISVPSDFQICNGATTANTNFTSSVTDTINTYKWTNTNTAIGIGSAGTGNINAFTATNNSNSQTFATISVTPYAYGGCAGLPKTFKITVNPTPVLVQPLNQTLCNNASTNAVAFTSSVTDTVNTYKWTNSNINTGLSAANGTGDIASFTTLNNGFKKDSSVIVVIPYAHGGCVGQAKTFKIYINPTPDVIQPSNQTICNNAQSSFVKFNSNVSGTSFSWTNDSPTIGIANVGNGDIPIFTAINISNAPIVATIKVLPTANTCVGTDKSFTFTINPTPVISYTGNTTICAESVSNIQLASTVKGTSYSWLAPSMTNATGGLASIVGDSVIKQNLFTITPAVGSADYKITAIAKGCASNLLLINLTINPLTKITLHPRDTIICADNPIFFRGGATGLNVTYQRQVNTGNGFVNITPDSNYSGINNHTLSISKINNNMAGYKYRMLASSSTCPKEVTGNIAGITLTSAPKIIDFPVNQEICEGGNTSFTVTATGKGLKYNWSYDDGSPLPSGNVFSDITTNSLTVNNASNDFDGKTLKVTVTGACLPSEVAFATLKITNPTINPIPDQEICSGITSNIKLISPLENVSYTWTTQVSNLSNVITGSSQNITNPIPVQFIKDKLVNTGTRDGYVIYTITPYKNGCKGKSATAIVRVYFPTNPTLNGPFYDVCKGSTLELKSTYYARGTYKWKENLEIIGGSTEKTNVIANGDTTLYELEFTDVCNQKFYAKTFAYPIPQAEFVIDTVPLCATFDLIYTPKVLKNKVDKFVWYFGENNDSLITDIKSPERHYIYDNVGDYKLKVNAYYNYCKVGEYSTDLNVKNCELTTYNTITPNGDGANEFWLIQNIEKYPNAKVQIFNRWGQIVWINDGAYNSKPFEGLNNNGEKLEQGVYYYIIDLQTNDKRKNHKKGYITVIREIR